MTMAQRVVRSVGLRLGQQTVLPADPTVYETEDDAPVSLVEAEQARRAAEYQARREGLKKPLLQVWKF